MSSDVGIEIHFDPEGGHLLLSCGAEEFARLRDFVLEEAQVQEIVGPSSLGVWRIEIESVPAVLAQRRKLRRGPAALVADLAIVAAILVFLVGLGTILRWIMQRLA